MDEHELLMGVNPRLLLDEKDKRIVELERDRTTLHSMVLQRDELIRKVCEENARLREELLTIYKKERKRILYNPKRMDWLNIRIAKLEAGHG